MKKRTVLLAAFCLFMFNMVYGQTCPKGFTEQYSYDTVGGGLVNNFKPSLIIRACIQDKSGSAGEQVFWNVKGLLHSYKTVRFIKHIKLTCGNVIDKKVVLYNLKKDQSVGGGSFSGDIDLSDNIFKEDCANAKRIDKVWADNFTCELADDDPILIAEKLRLENLANKKNYRDKLSGLRNKFKVLVDSGNAVAGGNKTKLDAYKSEFNRLSGNSVSLLNNAYTDRQLSQNEEKQLEDNISKMENILVDMDTEVSQLKLAQTGKKKTATKESASKAEIDRPVYTESEETRKMRQRAEAQQKKNDTENTVAATGAAAVVAGGMGLLGITDSDYDDEEYPVVVRAQLGASYQSIPVVSNYNGAGFTPKSENATTDPFCINTGVEAKFFHDRLVGFNVNPFFCYGILAFGSTTGHMINYGGNANLKVGKGLQLVLKGGYEVRNGKVDYDAAEIGIDGTTYARYNYNVSKYGLGIRYKFVELSGFKEQLSFEDRGEKRNANSFELSMAYSWFGMLIKYAPDYPVAGEVQYSSNYDFASKRSLFQIGMYWRISITRSR